MIPGRALHRLSARVCSAKTLERSVEPAIADLQQEYAGAGGVAGRVWILLTGYFAILKVIAICVGSVSVETDEERRTLVRTLESCAVMVALILVMLMVPPLSNTRVWDGEWRRPLCRRRWRWRFPSALPSALHSVSLLGPP